MGWFGKKVEPAIGDTVTFEDFSGDVEQIVTKKVIGVKNVYGTPTAIVECENSTDGVQLVDPREFRTHEKRRK